MKLLTDFLYKINKWWKKIAINLYNNLNVEKQKIDKTIEEIAEISAEAIPSDKTNEKDENCDESAEKSQQISKQTATNHNHNVIEQTTKVNELLQAGCRL